MLSQLDALGHQSPLGDLKDTQPIPPCEVRAGSIGFDYLSSAGFEPV